MAIHIEIDEGGYNPSRFWRIRIGDITGSTEHSNISKEEVLEDVGDAMDEIAVVRKSQGCKNCGHWVHSHYPKDKMECNVHGCDCKKFEEITALECSGGKNVRRNPRRIGSIRR